MLAAVDAGALLEVIWVSLLAGIGVTAVFSVLLFGTTRSAEARRGGQNGAALAFGALGLLAGLVFVGGVVLAVRLIITG